MTDLSVLEVLLHGDPIGTLTLLPNDKTLFAFTQSYIDNEKRPTLSLSFKQATGGLITDIPPTRVRVPAYFANLLPEGRLRDYLAARAGVNPAREFFLLWILGSDLPGALEIRPAKDEPWPPATGRLGQDSTDNQGAEKSVLRFSLAGVQLKFSAVHEATGGLTIPARGVGGSWIVKLPSTKFDGVPENEFSMMKLASRVGIDVPEVELVELSKIAGLPDDVGALDGNALAVKRFDRVSGGPKVHMEDFAQIFGVFPGDKYKKASYRNIAEVIWTETGEDGIAEYIRRLVFNALIGNADMHLKNWSLVYPDTRNAKLSPGYDFVSTIPYLPDPNMALKFGKSKKFKDLSIDMLSYFAGKALLPEKLVLDTAKLTVDRFHESWAEMRADLPMGLNVANAIDEHVARVPLAHYARKD